MNESAEESLSDIASRPGRRDSAAEDGLSEVDASLSPTKSNVRDLRKGRATNMKSQLSGYTSIISLGNGSVSLKKMSKLNDQFGYLSKNNNAFDLVL